MVLSVGWGTEKTVAFGAGGFFVIRQDAISPSVLGKPGFFSSPNAARANRIQCPGRLPEAQLGRGASPGGTEGALKIPGSYPET